MQNADRNRIKNPRVKIKDDLVVSSKTDAINFVRGMLPFISKKTKIIEQHIQLYLVIVGKFIILYV